jgi:hypothetical protein
MAEWIGGKTKAITAESRVARIKCRTKRRRAGRQKKAKWPMADMGKSREEEGNSGPKGPDSTVKWMEDKNTNMD